eukprot:TRINITY_DN5015_c0_g2_i2.p1 TRINITY_DN5015_c0_g2~~TRINITY_DN5015_c0_g2_i2.p1  ORF type:complete len:321 (+),score=62.27 TRINITY_DN5015_c0_g2_i2:183-1145(+)
MPIPVFVLAILFIRGLTLEGAGEGLRYFWEPKPEELLDPGVWIDAISQIFFSIAIGLGVMIAYGSYIPRSHDTMREAATIISLDVLFSLVAGMTVFSFLGHMADARNVSVADVAKGGPSLAFIVFPDAISLMPFPQLFSILFFSMLLLLGIPTAFSLVVAFTAIIYDRFPSLRNYTELTSAAICIIGFLSGLLLTTRSGLHFIDLVDHYLSNYLLILIGLLEAIGVGWFYPIETLISQLEVNIGRIIPPIWISLVKYVSPVLLVLLFSYNMVHEFMDSYGGYPGWALFIGWISVLVASCVMIFGACKPLNVDAGSFMNMD